jgi:hypothetical protein
VDWLDEEEILEDGLELDDCDDELELKEILDDELLGLLGLEDDKITELLELTTELELDKTDEL